MAAHNMAALLDAGLCVTVNSDDPAYFGGYLNQNFLATFDALPQLDARHAVQLALNSFEASFVPDEHTARWRDELARTVEQVRSEEHTSELQSLMRISYAVFCCKKQKQ